MDETNHEIREMQRREIMKLEVGKKYTCRNTKDIMHVEIVHQDIRLAYSFIGLITYADKNPVVDIVTYSKKGECGKLNYSDILAEYKEPIEHVRYLNIYTDTKRIGYCYFYSSRELANELSAPTRIACKRIVFKEGEFDD